MIILWQVIPLPRELVHLISPMSAQLRLEAAHTLETMAPSWIPLTLALYTTLAELAELFSYLAIFFLALMTFRKPASLLRALYIIIGTGFFYTFYGLLRFVSRPDSAPFAWVSANFVNKNHFAGYLELIIPLVFASLLIHFEKHNTDQIQTPEEKYMKSLFHLFVVFLMICAIFLSGSRAGLISFAGGVLGFTLLALARRLIRRWLAIMLLLLGLALGTFMIGNPTLRQRQFERFEKIEHSFQVRSHIWESAWHIFQDFPIIGSGLGTYAHLSRRYKTFPGELHFRYAENDYLQLLAETGALGCILALFTGIFFTFHLVKAWQTQKSHQALTVATGGVSAMVSILIHSSMDFNLHIPANTILFSIVAALTYNAIHIRKQRRSAKKAQNTSESEGVRSAGSSFRTAFRFRRYGAFSAMLGSLGIYVGYILISFAGFQHHQAGITTIPQNIATLHHDQQDQILSHLYQAVRYAPWQAEYAHTLGKFLYTVMTHKSPWTDGTFAAGGFEEAEQWLKRAILLDPANPWYYYDLGRLAYNRGDCHSWQTFHPNEPWDACLVTRYFRAALQNAPQHPFFRETLIRWYAFYDREQARQLLQDMVIGDRPNVPIDQGVDRFAQLLYDFGMDYESELLVQQFWSSTAEARSSCQPHVIHQSENNSTLEIGSDDGTAEWSSPLTSETDRIKKTLCLPEDLAPYEKASVLIRMNHQGEGDFTLSVGVDADVLNVSGLSLTSSPAWHEFPIEMGWLQGKSWIQIYLRCHGVTTPEHAPLIWGDMHTSTHTSRFNFRNTHDLSSDPGRQTGEYMIRLLLQKQGSRK